jgi:pyruvate dehydrogenase E2 component (dihydrolipoamide acetyltransferase)
MAHEFKLPDIGEGVVEGEISKWFVKEGDAISEDDPLVEVMTDKVNVEIPSPFSGVVLKILAEEGQTVDVGTTIVVIGEEGEEVELEEAAPVEEAPATVGAAAPAPARDVGPAVRAAPAVRRLAKERAVDLTTVVGTGPGGRITKEDVLAAGEVGPPAAEEGEVERIPLRGVRKRISDHMLKAVTTAAHYTYVEEVDMTELVRLRERLKAERGGKLTYLPFIVKAVTAALREFPYLNASLDLERQEIVLKRYYNIGIATHTEEGLVVPVVKDCDRKSVYEIAEDIDTLAEKARSRRLELDDVRGGTFSITSPGKLGGVLATPIVNYPEVAILGVHKISKRAVVRDGEIVVRDMMNLALSFDHRVVDGFVGAEFTHAIKNRLEDPSLLDLGEA